ncbi:MAG: hypothetical protein H6772_03905 [Pseudomonadales bacterium]|nr:hypothetical protein [Pseudomonadales bacterium]
MKRHQNIIKKYIKNPASYCGVLIIL